MIEGNLSYSDFLKARDAMRKLVTMPLACDFCGTVLPRDQMHIAITDRGWMRYCGLSTCSVVVTFKDCDD